MDKILFRHDQLNTEPSVPMITKVNQIVEVRTWVSSLTDSRHSLFCGTFRLKHLTRKIKHGVHPHLQTINGYCLCFRIAEFRNSRYRHDLPFLPLGGKNGESG